MLTRTDLDVFRAHAHDARADVAAGELPSRVLLLVNAINDMATALCADRLAGLTPAQRQTIAHHQAGGVPAGWFVSTSGAPDGSTQVIALGDDFVWSLRIDSDGSFDSSEATVGKFETGITF